MKKRLLAMLLSCVMILGLLPTAMAEDIVIDFGEDIAEEQVIEMTAPSSDVMQKVPAEAPDSVPESVQNAVGSGNVMCFDGVVNGGETEIIGEDDVIVDSFAQPAKNDSFYYRMWLWISGEAYGDVLADSEIKVGNLLYINTMITDSDTGELVTRAHPDVNFRSFLEIVFPDKTKFRDETDPGYQDYTCWTFTPAQTGVHSMSLITEGGLDGSFTRQFDMQPADVPVTKVTLNKTSYTLEKGKTFTLKATVSPTKATNKTIKWSSSDKAIATVTSKGVVKGIKTGTATITAKSVNGKKATCKVKVVKEVPVSSIALNKETASVTKGKTITLEATIKPSNATDKTVKWSSSDKTIATVTSKGVVKGVKKGTATITAKSVNGKKATCKVTVKNPVAVTSVELDYTSVKMKTLATKKLTATVKPSNAVDKTITWSSSKTRVATVSSSGKITAKCCGTTTITAESSNGKKATCKIMVRPTIDRISYYLGNNAWDMGYDYDELIPLQVYQIMFPAARAQQLYENQNGFGGVCYGMVTGAGMMSYGTGEVKTNGFRSGATVNSDLEIEDYNSTIKMDLKRFIACMFVSQWDEAQLDFERAHRNDLESLASAVKKMASGGAPVQISLYWERGGHSVMGLYLEKVSDKQSRIHIYDPNYPLETRYIYLTTNSSGKYTSWEYEVFDDEETIGTKYDSVISHIPYSYYYAPWENRNKSKVSTKTNLVSVNSDDFEVLDESGAVVAAMSNGTMNSNDPSVRRVVAKDLSASQKCMISMPCGEYTIVSRDAGELEVSVSDAKQYARVTTEANKVSFDVSDFREVNQISVGNAKDKTYAVELFSVLDSVSGKKTVSFSGKGSGKTVTVGAQKGKFVSNDKAAIVKVNGTKTKMSELS